MNIFLNIHFNIHSVFKVFRAFRRGQVILQLLQGSKTPSETFSGAVCLYVRDIYARSVGYIVLYANVATYSRRFRRLIIA